MVKCPPGKAKFRLVSTRRDPVMGRENCLLVIRRTAHLPCYILYVLAEITRYSLRNQLATVSRRESIYIIFVVRRVRPRVKEKSNNQTAVGERKGYTKAKR
jgi:hypothetical protein